MARVSVSLFAVFVTVALGVPAGAAATAPVPPQDFVVGGGEVGLFHEISVDARSDPLGGDPSGAVSFVAEIPIGGTVARVRFEGPVTCLAVDGNRAVIGFRAFIGPLKVVVADNGSAGSPADEFGVGLQTSGCSDETGVGVSPLSGDITVRDASPKPNARTAAGAATRTWPGGRSRVKATASPSRSALSDAHGGAGIGVTGGFLHIAQPDAVHAWSASSGTPWDTRPLLAASGYEAGTTAGGPAGPARAPYTKGG